MNTKIILTMLLIAVVNNLFAQTYKALNKVNMDNSFILKKKAIISNCPQNIDKGAQIKSTTTYKNTSKENEEIITVTKEMIADDNEIILIDKSYIQDIKSFDGYANIFVDQTDNSVIHVNYWLSDQIQLLAGTKIRTITQTLQCDKTYSKKSSEISELNANTSYNLWQCSTEEIKNNPDLLKYSDTIIEVYQKDGKTLNYYLVNKYDKNADYTIQLANRDVIYFKETGIEFGPVTIPIKIRPGFKENNVSIPQDFSNDFNLGAFVGWKIGKYRARYIRGEGFSQLPTSSSATMGVFLSFSTTSLDKANTSVGKNPIIDDSKQTIGIISPGIGILYSFYNFQIGIFSGLDLGMGSHAKNWNYNGRPWVGFGFGYNLSNFWKK